MSSSPNLMKEQSIIMDNNEINNINNENINKSNSNANILKTEIITNEIDDKIPKGEQAEFNLNLNGEVKIKSPREEKTAVCWNCQSLLMIKDGWDIVECSECHKLNRIPVDKFPIDQRISLAKSYGNLNQNQPLMYGIVVCPVCQTENKFSKNTNDLICYRCGNNIYLNNNKVFNSYENNFINRSYDFPIHPREIIQYPPYNPNVIQLRGMIPYPPMIPCYGNCAECTLLKILKALTKKPKETYVPYPMYPYIRHEEPPKKEIRYVPMNTESKKVEPEDEGFKIVIRKKPKGSRDSLSMGKNNAFYWTTALLIGNEG